MHTLFNQAPTVSYDPSQTVAGSDSSIIGKLYGGDADGDTVTYRITAQPETGTVTVDETGVFRYTPSDASAATGSPVRFTAEVSDLADAGWLATLTDALFGNHHISTTVTLTSTDATTLGVSSTESTIAVDNPGGLVVSPDGSTLYVIDDVDDLLNVIDTATDTVTTSIAVGANPQAVIVNSAGTAVYVANYDDSTVSVIDTDSNTVSATIVVGAHPDALVLNVHDDYLFVVSDYDNAVVRVDLSTNSSEYVSVGQGPTAVAYDYDDDAGTVYVTNSGDGTVSVIKASTFDSVEATITVGAGPSAIALSDNYAYVTNATDDTVSIIDIISASATYNTVVKTVDVGAGPSAVALSAENDYVYVTNTDDDTLTIIGGTLLATIDTLTVGAAPVAVATSLTTGAVYVANQGDDTISVLTSTTDYTFTSTDLGTSNVDYGPNFHLAIDSTGSALYLTDREASELLIFDIASSTVTYHGSDYDNAYGVALDSDDNVYVADYRDGTVTTIGNPESYPWTLSVGGNPQGLAIVDDTLFVSDTANDQVLSYSLSTFNNTGSFDTGSAPGAITVSGTGYVYVANVIDGTVSVGNPSEDKEEATVDVGNSPSALAVNSTSDLLYVANSADNTLSVVSVLDPDAPVVVDTIDVGTAPSAMAISPDGTQVWVTNFGDDTISVIDADATSATYHSVIATYFVNSGPTALVFAPDGETVYVAGSGDGTIGTLTLTDTDSASDVGDRDTAVVAPQQSNPLGELLGAVGTFLRTTFANQGPSVAYDPASVLQSTDAEGTVTITGDLGASDPENNALSYQLVDGPADGVVVVHDDGTFTYTLDADLAATGGSDTFTVAVTDTGGLLGGLVKLFNPTAHTTQAAVTVPVEATELGESQAYYYVENQASDTVVFLGYAVGGDLSDLTSTHHRLYEGPAPGTLLPTAGNFKILLESNTYPHNFDLDVYPVFQTIPADGSDPTIYLVSISERTDWHISCAAESGSGTCTSTYDPWKVYFQDAADTTVTYGADQPSKQEYILNNFVCGDSGVSCTVTVSSEDDTLADAQLVDEVPNVTDTDQTSNTAVSQPVVQAVDLDLSDDASTAVLDLIEAAVESAESRTWYSSYTFTDTVSVSVPADSTAAVYFQAPLYTDYVTITVVVANTTYYLTDVAATSPNPDGTGVYTVTCSSNDGSSASGTCSVTPSD